MPLEIKYKNIKPIASIKLKYGPISIILEEAPNSNICIGINYRDTNVSSNTTAAEFKEWAAAVYKFSQEI